MSGHGYCPRCFRGDVPVTRAGRFGTHMTGCTHRRRCTNHAKCPHKRPCPGIGQHLTT